MGKALLDLVLAMGDDLIGDLVIDGKLGDSDNELITFIICRKAGKSVSSTEVVDFRIADFDKLKRLVGQALRDHDPREMGVQEEWLLLKEVILSAQAKSIPTRRKGSKKAQQPPWLSRDLADLLWLKRKAYKEWRMGFTSKEDYSALVRSCRDQTRKAKAATELQLASGIKDNKKSFFRYVGSRRKSKGNIGPLLNQMGQLTTDAQEKANELNGYFASVFHQSHGTSMPAMGQGDPGDGDPLPSINADLVKEHLEKLDTFKSAGPDNLHPRVLKELASVIAQPLARIFENSWRSGVVPEDWKKANVVPIFKKGRRVDLANYRPISLTSILGKILEKFIKEAILEGLAQANILRDSQHGVDAGRSCLTNLISFYDQVTYTWTREKRLMSYILTSKKPLIWYPTITSWPNCPVVALAPPRSAGWEIGFVVGPRGL